MSHRRALVPSVSVPNFSSLTSSVFASGSTSGSAPGGSSTSFSSSTGTSSTLTGSSSSPSSPSVSTSLTQSASTSAPSSTSTPTPTSTTPTSTPISSTTASSTPGITTSTSITTVTPSLSNVTSQSGWTPYTTSTSYSTITSELPNGFLTTYTTAIPTALYSPPSSNRSASSGLFGSSRTALIAGLTAGVVTLFLVGLGMLWWKRTRRGIVQTREREVKAREEKKWGLVPSNSIWRKKSFLGVRGPKETRRLLEDEDFDEEVRFESRTGGASSVPASPLPVQPLQPAHEPVGPPMGRRMSMAAPPVIELLSTVTQPQPQPQRTKSHARKTSLRANAALSRNSSYRDPFGAARSIADSVSIYSQESAHGLEAEEGTLPPVPPVPPLPSQKTPHDHDPTYA